MKTDVDSNEEPLASPDASFKAHSNGAHRAEPGSREAKSRFATNGHSTKKDFDFWTAADILAQRWHWLVIGGILGAAALFTLGMYVVKPKYTAVAILQRFEPAAMSEFLKTTQLTPETFSSLIVSPDLLRRVGDQLSPPMSPDKLVKCIKVDPQIDSDMVKLHVAQREPQPAVDLANLYAKEVVAFMKEIQKNQAEDVARTYLKQQVEQMDQDIKAMRAHFGGMPAQVTNQLANVSTELTALGQTLSTSPRRSILIAKQSEQLQAALLELNELRLKYKDLHPLVQQANERVNQLEKDLEKSASDNPNGSVSFSPDGKIFEPDMEFIRARLRALEESRVQMVNHQHEAESLAANPPGTARLFAAANRKTAEDNKRWLKISFVGVVGGILGMGCGLLLLMLVEFTDRRIRTAEDVKRVTRLPLLTTLGDLRRMEDRERTQWAFRTWTMLQGRLSRSQNHGLICGLISANEGEGRSTWISLLAEAASLSGFRVLTIATRPSASHIGSPAELLEGTLNNNNNSEMKTTASETTEAVALTGNVLASPSKVTEQLTGPDSQPVVHIPLPGWVWNLDRRKEWGNALGQWKQIDNLVIFVELPPASVPEAVLLGSNLPNVVWLSSSGTADAAETRSHLETLRYARCNLVGAVLNREPAPSVKTRFPRWFATAILFGTLAMSSAQAQVLAVETNAPLPVEAPLTPTGGTEPSQPEPHVSFSIVDPGQRAAWQQHLTLGPGDVLSFALYGEPTLNRTEVVIPPDGRISYLQAQDILVTGLTVDELREKIDGEIGKYYRAPRTIITPVAYRSKKYYVLGKVTQKGVYTLDRPITVIEAIARAKGIESGLVDNNTIDLVDFSRSFLMRGGKRIPLDFEKLFQSGDLSQNLQIEPGDYLFFPSTNVRQVYVLGEVGLPGPATYTPNLTAVGAISSRGGFNEKAYKSHVLVVRGSLNKPETFIVDVMAVTKGKAQDLRLQPKDIVYVSHRPFYRAEDLLDLAATAFTQAAVSAWVTEDIVKP